MRKQEAVFTITADYPLLQKGNQIVIPNLLQKQIIDLTHSGHQGIVKTKSLLREKVWFVGIDNMVEEIVKKTVENVRAPTISLERSLNLFQSNSKQTITLCPY